MNPHLVLKALNACKISPQGAKNITNPSKSKYCKFNTKSKPFNSIKNRKVRWDSSRLGWSSIIYICIGWTFIDCQKKNRPWTYQSPRHIWRHLEDMEPAWWHGHAWLPVALGYWCFLMWQETDTDINSDPSGQILPNLSELISGVSQHRWTSSTYKKTKQKKPSFYSLIKLPNVSLGSF